MRHTKQELKHWLFSLQLRCVNNCTVGVCGCMSMKMCIELQSPPKPTKLETWKTSPGIELPPIVEKPSRPETQPVRKQYEHEHG